MLRLPKPAVAALTSFVVALVVRLAFIVESIKSPFMGHRLIDENDYHVMAERLLQHTWPGPEALFRPPLYPMFLASVYRLFGEDIYTTKLVQAGLGSLVAAMTVAIAYELFQSSRVALAAGLIVAFSGTLVYFDGQILAGGLDVLLVTASVALLLRADRRGRAVDWALAGATIGLSALNRGAMVGAIPVIAGWALALPGSATRIHVARHLVAFSVAAACVMAPLAWHNARYDDNPEGAYAASGPKPSANIASVSETFSRIVRRRFSPLGWADGVNLYLGNLPELVDVNRDDTLEHFRWFNEVNQEPWKAGAKTATEHSLWFRRKTAAYIANHPGDWLVLLGHKVLELVNGYEPPRGTNPYAEREYSRTLSALLWDGPIRFPSGLVLPLGIAGAFALCRDRRALLVALMMGTQLAFVLAFFVTARYRIPALPMAAVLAVGFVARVLAGVRSVGFWGHRRLGGALGTFALVALSNVPLARQSVTRGGLEHYNLATALAEEGRRDLAIDHLRAAIRVTSPFASAHNNLGRMLQDEGRVEEAIPEYLAAIREDPRSAHAENNLGTALLAQGDTAGAEAAFLSAAALDATYGRPRLNLADLVAARGDVAAALLWLKEAATLRPEDATIAARVRQLEDVAAQKAR